jgi:hypothetical protein
MVILLANVAFSQDFFDALRYSQTNYGGSARSIAMGSAFGALGGDFVSASINPAGMGLYRTSELSFSPTLNINNAYTDYLGSTSSDRQTRFNFDNISYVGSIKTGFESGISGLTIGIGYNRLKNFNSKIYIVGHDAQTTLLDYYTDWANTIGEPDKFNGMNEDLAWQTYLVDVDKDPSVLEGRYFNDLADYSIYDIYDNGGNVIGSGYKQTGVKKHTQRSNITTSGKIDEYLLSMGLNVNHKLYFGASIGLLDLEYNERTRFTEIDDQGLSDVFNNYSQTSNFYYSGVGVNFKAGIIYRPVKSLRVGLAIHTPNAYTIDADENKGIDANYDKAIGDINNGESTSWSRSVSDYYQYKLQTPFKAIASLSYLLGTKGLISVDYEYQDYSSNTLKSVYSDYESKKDYYNDRNLEIDNLFHSVGNLRIGAEYRATENFSLRAGFQLLGNPWNSKYTYDDGSSIDLANQNDNYTTYSAGFGYRKQNFFIDFAYRLSNINEAYKVHEMSANNPSNGTNIASVNYLNNQATITFGFRF